MNKQITKKTALITLLLLVIGSVFYSSSQPYGDQTLIPFLEKVWPSQPFKEVLQKVEFYYGGKIVSVEQSGYYNFIEFFIRKATHFSVYAIMGAIYILILHAFNMKKQLIWAVALLTLILFAISDEWHQSFTANRTPLIADILIDSLGVCFGLVIGFIFMKRHRKKS